MPIAIAPINGKARTVALKLAGEARDQLAILLIDGTPAAEVIIMLRHFEQTFALDIAPAQNVLEERNHLIRLLRSAKRKDQNCIVIGYVVIWSNHPSTLSPAAAVEAVGTAMRLPVRPHPNGVGMRRPPPLAGRPSPASAAQVPKSIHPHKARSGRVAHCSHHVWCGRRSGNAISNVGLRGAGSKHGGCKHHTSENSLFQIHENAS